MSGWLKEQKKTQHFFENLPHAVKLTDSDPGSMEVVSQTGLAEMRHILVD